MDNFLKIKSENIKMIDKILNQDIICFNLLELIYNERQILVITESNLSLNIKQRIAKWEEVGRKLTELVKQRGEFTEIEINGENCKSKFNRLRTTYRKVRNNLTRSARGKKWKYFDIMSRILSCVPIVKSSNSIEDKSFIANSESEDLESDDKILKIEDSITESPNVTSRSPVTSRSLVTTRSTVNSRSPLTTQVIYENRYSQKKSNLRKKQKVDAEKQFEIFLEKATSKLDNINNATQPPSDTLTCYGTYIGQRLKGLTIEKQCIAINLIDQVMLRVSMDNDPSNIIVSKVDKN